MQSSEILERLAEADSIFASRPQKFSPRACLHIVAHVVEHILSPVCLGLYIQGICANVKTWLNSQIKFLLLGKV